MKTHHQFAAVTTIMFYRYASYRVLHETLNELQRKHFAPARQLVHDKKPGSGAAHGIMH